MNQPQDISRQSALTCILLIAGAALDYWLAFATRHGASFIFLAMPCIFSLSGLKTSRQAFYVGALCGFAIYVPQLWFFLRVFHAAAVALWCIAALPIALFVLLLHQSRRFGPITLMCLTPVLWTGIEFFRSELYYFRFAWILPGQAAAFLPGLQLAKIGVYGTGFVFALASAMLIGPRKSCRILGAFFIIALSVLMYWPTMPSNNLSQSTVNVAGIQLENASDTQIASALEHLATTHPETQILVLSEYSFGGPVPKIVRDVVRKHSRYLIAGGMLEEPNNQFRDTAFVIGPDGNDLFNQCKSVPVQLMADGLPAKERKVWNSPWGKIGIAICYDISYAKVMDDFVRAGARGLIIPTMDLQSWGRYEREMLHGRLAPIRSAEYGIPVFGVWSSGESQLTDHHGRIIATAGYPGQNEIIAGPFVLTDSAHVPIDRYPALAASVFTGAFILYLVIRKPTHANSIAAPEAAA